MFLQCEKEMTGEPIISGEVFFYFGHHCCQQRYNDSLNKKILPVNYDVYFRFYL